MSDPFDYDPTGQIGIGLTDSWDKPPHQWYTSIGWQRAKPTSVECVQAEYIMTSDDIKAAAERLRAFVRKHTIGECRILSKGNRCTCLLCSVDMLVRTEKLFGTDSEFERRIAALEAKSQQRDPRDAVYGPIKPDPRDESLEYAEELRAAIERAKKELATNPLKGTA